MSDTPQRCVTWKWCIAVFIALPITLFLLLPTFLLRKTFELFHHLAYEIDEVMNNIVAVPLSALRKWSKRK